MADVTTRPREATLASLHHSMAWALPFTGLPPPRLRAHQGQQLAFRPVYLGSNVAGSTGKVARKR